jgi:hypothetical protein
MNWKQNFRTDIFFSEFFLWFLMRQYVGFLNEFIIIFAMFQNSQLYTVECTPNKFEKYVLTMQQYIVVKLHLLLAKAWLE